MRILFSYTYICVCDRRREKMKTRVNLTIDEALLDKVKQYASMKQRSVSDLVETYFRTFIDAPTNTSLVDMVENLPKSDLKARGDLKKRYMEENAQKYGF